MAWEVKGDLIKTRWAAQIDPENVLPEYPTPQFQRKDWLNLNGDFSALWCGVTAFGRDARAHREG